MFSVRERGRRLALTATIALTALAAAAQGASAQSTLLDWGECPPPFFGENAPGLECANVSVPLDYQAPQGRRIDIAISRLRTSTPEKRRGVILLNPGGPGGPGLDMPGLLAETMPQSVLERHDLIGFDPRGIGRSAPLTCGLDLLTIQFERIIPWPDPRGLDE
ncbi:MAG: hypothetical protein ACRDSN_22135, partial [Pseudonocardiaceae bacterium]